MNVKIAQALNRLDPANDDHWTSDGLPRLGAIKELSGESFSREEVTAAFPQFTRGNPVTDPEDNTSEDIENEGDGNYQAAVNAAELEVAKAAKDVEAAEQILAKAKARQVKAERKLEAQEVRDPYKTVKDIQAYRDTQRMIREKRAAARRKIHESGLDLRQVGAIIGSAPIDAAMSRRRAFGMRRPAIAQPVTTGTDNKS